MRKIFILILLIIVIVVVTVLSVLPRIGHFQIESPTHIYTGKVGKYEITAKSILFYTGAGLRPDVRDYCEQEKKLFYVNPTISIKNTETNVIDTYELIPRQAGTRLTIWGTSYSDSQMEFPVLFENYTQNCDGKHQSGMLIMNQQGNFISLKLPTDALVDQANVLKNGQEIDLKINIYPYTQVVKGDLNHDGISDYFAIQEPSLNSNLWTGYMMNLNTNQPSPWFNDGKPLVTSENIDEAISPLSKADSFLKKYASVWRDQP